MWQYPIVIVALAALFVAINGQEYLAECFNPPCSICAALKAFNSEYKGMEAIKFSAGTWNMGTQCPYTSIERSRITISGAGSGPDGTIFMIDPSSTYGLFTAGSSPGKSATRISVLLKDVRLKTEREKSPTYLEIPGIVIFAQDTNDFNISNVVFDGLHTGISVKHVSTAQNYAVRVSNCSFVKCVRGVHVTGESTSVPVSPTDRGYTVTITDSVFEDNDVTALGTGDSMGAGVHVYNAGHLNLTLDKCRFVGNTADHAAAIAILASSPSYASVRVEILHSTFKGNSVTCRSNNGHPSGAGMIYAQFVILLLIEDSVLESSNFDVHCSHRPHVDIHIWSAEYKSQHHPIPSVVVRRSRFVSVGILTGDQRSTDLEQLEVLIEESHFSWNEHPTNLGHHPLIWGAMPNERLAIKNSAFTNISTAVIHLDGMNSIVDVTGGTFTNTSLEGEACSLIGARDGRYSLRNTIFTRGGCIFRGTLPGITFAADNVVANSQSRYYNGEQSLFTFHNIKNASFIGGSFINCSLSERATQGGLIFTGSIQHFAMSGVTLKDNNCWRNPVVSLGTRENSPSYNATLSNLTFSNNSASILVDYLGYPSGSTLRIRDGVYELQNQVGIHVKHARLDVDSVHVTGYCEDTAACALDVEGYIRPVEGRTSIVQRNCLFNITSNVDVIRANFDTKSWGMRARGPCVGISTDDGCKSRLPPSPIASEVPHSLPPPLEGDLPEDGKPPNVPGAIDTTSSFPMLVAFSVGVIVATLVVVAIVRWQWPHPQPQPQPQPQQIQPQGIQQPDVVDQLARRIAEVAEERDAARRTIAEQGQQLDNVQQEIAAARLDSVGLRGRLTTSENEIHRLANEVQTMAVLAESNSNAAKGCYKFALAFLPLPIIPDQELQVNRGALLGRGMDGTVWAGTLRGNIDVAVKGDMVIDIETSGELISRAMQFLREACILARLDSPHVVRIYGITLEVHPTTQLRCPKMIVMEYLSRLPVRMTLANIRKLGAHVSAALHSMHTNDPIVIHRDIKPANILHDEQNQSYKLADVGVARLIGRGSLSLGTRGVGTQDFMAPEVQNGEEQTPASDIYMLGATIVQLILRDNSRYPDLATRLAAMPGRIDNAAGGDAVLADFLRTMTDVNPTARPNAQRCQAFFVAP